MFFHCFLNIRWVTRSGAWWWRTSPWCRGSSPGRASSPCTPWRPRTTAGTRRSSGSLCRPWGECPAGGNDNCNPSLFQVQLPACPGRVLQLPVEHLQLPARVSDRLGPQVSGAASGQDSDQVGDVSHRMCLLTTDPVPQVRHAGRPGPHQSEGGQQCAGVQRGLTIQGHLRHSEQIGEQCQHPDGSLQELRDHYQQVSNGVTSIRSDLWPHFRPGPVFTVSVPRRSSLVAAHVLPLSPDWNLEAEAKYIRWTENQLCGAVVALEIILSDPGYPRSWQFVYECIVSEEDI